MTAPIQLGEVVRVRVWMQALVAVDRLERAVHETILAPKAPPEAPSKEADSGAREVTPRYVG